MVNAACLLPECQRDSAIAITTTVLVIYLYDSAFNLFIFIRRFKRFQVIVKGASWYLSNLQKLVERVVLPQFVDNPDSVSYRTKAFSFLDKVPVIQGTELFFPAPEYVYLSNVPMPLQAQQDHQSYEVPFFCPHEENEALALHVR